VRAESAAAVDELDPAHQPGSKRVEGLVALIRSSLLGLVSRGGFHLLGFGFLWRDAHGIWHLLWGPRFEAERAYTHAPRVAAN
jgi:hypothetical protein